MMKIVQFLRIVAVSMAAGVLLTGCATLPRDSFSLSEDAIASPAGFANVRFTENSPALTAAMEKALTPDAHGDVNALALSGGGANGAYGAGLVYGWGKSGAMPKFQLVTGVSTGALTAPFAFLGRDWSEQLRKSYLEGKVYVLLKGRGLLSLITPGLFSRAPLDDLVRGYVTDDLLRAVAAEHARGRRLLVATTNLDTEQLIVWDMGAIATRGGAPARELFAQVLVASASVPGVFPPSLIQVESNGRRFEEMHVDGQTESAFFAVPPRLLLTNAASAQPGRVQFYIVVNGRMDSLFAVTPRSSLPILGRSFDVAARASVRQMLISTAEFCRRSGCALHVSAMPVEQKDDPLDFRAKHIRSLFAGGQASLDADKAWQDVSQLP